jgi:hypothetical protein
MNILHILNDGPSGLSDRIISIQKQEFAVKVVDLSGGNVSYDELVDDIFAFDRVISW